MKMSMSGMEGIELDGRIARSRVAEGSLVLELRLSKPVGWQASARLTRADVWSLVWMLLSSPRALGFVLFGLGNKSGTIRP